jgi:putative sterol carrier protein
VRLYSEEWVSAFNEAVVALDQEADVSFRVLQIVDGGPDGVLRIALCVHEGRVSLERGAGEEPSPDVTVALHFDDALALTRGEVDPAGLLATGRIKVRGDLSVLVRGQSLLAAAVRRLEPLSERTTS